MVVCLDVRQSNKSPRLVALQVRALAIFIPLLGDIVVYLSIQLLKKLLLQVFAPLSLLV